MSAPTPAALQVDATVADRDLRVALTVAPGEVVAIVGPNGAGKSSLIRLVTGQLRPSAGTVVVNGAVLSGPRTHVPVHRRGVALLDQRPALFEHLDVLANVAFGPMAGGASRTAAESRARAELDAVGCADLAGRRIWEISGGQAQRVAVARALATDPTLVLLDEPMAALDVTVAPAVRALLRQRIRDEGRTAVLVTHDMIDALSLADTLVVMDAGRIVSQGPVAELMTRPRDPFLANLTGTNLVAGVGESADTLRLPTGEQVTGVLEGGLAVGAPALASFAPAAVAVHVQVPTGSPRNHLAATVTGMEPRGGLVRLSARLADGAAVASDLTLSAAVEADLQPGSRVWLAVKAAQVQLYPR